MKRRVICGLLVILSWAGALALAEEHYEVVVERSVPAKMRDGVVLRADIYRPKADGKFPVLLTRTPYDKRGEMDFGPTAAARGYVVISQDVRGRYSSEGEWYTFKNESQDGYDTVEWAAALPYSNGKVGMFGGSYVGATQMLTAIAAPPHLAGILPVVTASNYHENWTYQGGAFEQWFDQSWTTGLAENTLDRRMAKDSYATRWHTKLPLTDYPLLDLGTPTGLADYYLDWLAHPGYDEYWKQWSIEEHFSQIQVPALHVAAWYDLFQDGSFRNYLGIKAHGASDVARNGQRLLVMVGGHAGSGPVIGEVDFGKDSVVDEGTLTLRWYDYLLKGVENGMGSEKPVKLLVMGKNVWREEEGWPLARAKAASYYLHSAGKANTLRGDGTLSTTAPATEAADKYVYDPADPAPTRGGPLCCDSTHQPPGAFDQRPVENREDVLVYTTPAFKQDTEVTGPVTLELYASSSAVDTDFTGKLSDVWPNGFAQNLTEGILRGRYRTSREKAELMNPGEVYRLTLNLWSTSNVFLAGHKLRLEVSSSNFPRFDRNLNTGEEPGHSARMVKATNAVYHDREHPSALILPVVSQ
ncbi:MAG TPA: CocE/NonD family hydrolase [Terriglobia bacterium]|nr:CocE/NonD family hydrolase [Terriglobia bacterium]